MMKKADRFLMPYFSEGWDFEFYQSTPRALYLAADTETKMYFEGGILSDDEAYRIYRDEGQEYFRQHVEVRAYAFSLSDGKNFAIFQCPEDFFTACCALHARLVFWYNAKFDFSIFDYYFLTHGWLDNTEEIERNHKYHKFPPKTYENLVGDFGQRYSLRVWWRYKNERCQWKTHNFRNLDVSNILGGGLGKCLRDFDIRDKEGNPLRKLEMDYTAADLNNPADVAYMKADVVGLWYLAMRMDKEIKSLTGLSFLKVDYITVGGVAIKTLLKYLFGSEKLIECKYLFKKYFPMTVEGDKEFRENGLYMGGKCLINPRYKGKRLEGLYKYDVNSMYPFVMETMKYPIGLPRVILEPRFKKDKIYIIYLKNLFGHCRDGFVPTWQDHITNDYKEIIDEKEERFIWKEELDATARFYYLKYDFLLAYEFDAAYMPGAGKFVGHFYDVKQNNRKTALGICAKKILNSAYGKVAQRVLKPINVIRLSSSGICHLEQVGEKIDKKAMLSVVVGSRITALARCVLMSYMLDVSRETVDRDFVYCDTDSIVSLCPYAGTDQHKIGWMKYEGFFERGIFLAPKSYFLYNSDDDFDIHAKGVNLDVVRDEMTKEKGFEGKLKVFRSNRLFKCLCAMNVRGGKALVYVDKMILREDNYDEYRDQNEGLDNNLSYE